MAKYYYNGVLLPEIPVIEGYPYAWIRKAQVNSCYDLAIADNIYYYDSSDKKIYLTGNEKWYQLSFSESESATEWTYHEDIIGSSWWNIVSGRADVIWSNFDIPKNSTTSTDIYFYGSEPVPEYIQKYLIKTDDKLYTVVDGALSELATTDIVAQTFLDYGVDEIPDGELLVGLDNIEVLCWRDCEDDLPTLTAIVTATPPYQIIMSRAIDLMHSSIKGIDSITVDCKGDVLFAVSFDNKATWVKHNGTDWVDVADELTGMTKLEFEAITAEQWQAKYELSSDMYIRCTLTDATQSVTSVNISFIN